ARRDHGRLQGRLLRRRAGPRSGGQADERSGGTLGAARALSGAGMADLLALGGAAPGGRALAVAPARVGVAGAARRLGPAVLARARGGSDQAAALRPAALPGA